MNEQVFFFSQPEYNLEQIQQAVEEFFAHSEACQKLTPDTKVLLKPNLLAKHAPEKSVTTHPVVVQAVIRALKSKGVKTITVADSPGGVYTPAIMKAIGQASGLEEVCKQEGAEFYTQCQFSTCSAEGKLMHQFTLLEPVLQANFIINLPKMKTHVMTNMTGAVKNLFGTIPGLQKAELHMRFPQKQYFGNMLCDLWEKVRPDITVMDAIVAMEGDGPAGGNPRKVGLLLAAENPWNLDLAVCGLMGVNPQQVPYLDAAIRRGICQPKFQPQWVEGAKEKYHTIEGYKLPSGYVEMDFSNRFPVFLRWASPAIVKFAAPRPKVQQEKCIGCGKCAEICPGKTIAIQNKKAKILPANCIRCFCCHEMCPVKAIDVVRPLGALFNL